MKILVTGGGGFLGGYIVRALLDEGYDVVAFQRHGHPELEALGVKVVQGSLESVESIKSALEGCQAVIHTAAKAGVWGPRHEYFTTNVDGTRHLLQAMEATNVRDLVHCSTASVVFHGDAFHGEDEALPYGENWLCTYPETKAIAEEMVLHWGKSGKGRVIALRPHLIWGVGDPHLLPEIIERSRAGRLRIIGDGSNRVDVTRVENVAAAHVLALKALEKPSALNRPYFISQGDPVVLWDWINEVLEQLGIAPIKKRFSLGSAFGLGTIFEWLWKILGRQSVPPMTRFVSVELAKDHWFSIEAARRELNYRPEEFPMDKGLELYVRSLQASRES